MTEIKRLPGNVCIGNYAGITLNETDDYYLVFNKGSILPQSLVIHPNGDIYIDDVLKYKTGEDLNDLLRECVRFTAEMIAAKPPINAPQEWH